MSEMEFVLIENRGFTLQETVFEIVLAGARGPTGATGADGAKGDTGADGAKGDKGDKGDTGDFPALDSLDAKAVVVAADLALVGDSADTFNNKKSTWQQIIDTVLSVFVLLAGRAGGQTISGGTGSGETATIRGTSHATPGHVLLNPDGGNVGIGVPVGDIARDLTLKNAIGIRDSISTAERITIDYGVTNFSAATISTIASQGWKLVSNHSAAPSMSFVLNNGSGLVDRLVIDGAYGCQVSTATLEDATGNQVAYSLNYTTNKATSGDDTGLQINMTDTASPGTSLLQDWQVDTLSQANMDSNGDLLNKNGVYGTISDEDLKQNIIKAGPQLADLMLMNFYNYELVGDDGIKLLGPLAQELEKIKAGLVTDTPHMITVPDLEWKPSPEEVEIIPAVMGERQKVKIDKVEKGRIIIVLIDGDYVENQTVDMVDIETPVFEEFPLHDNDRNVIGSHKVPVIEEYEKTPEKRIVIKEATTESDRPMVRKHDGLYIKTVKQSVFIWILCICMQELTKRVEAVEDAQKTLN